MYAGVSGLNSEAAAMATVADNITNVNTIGYKSAQANFSTMVAGGTTSSTYVAGGVKVSPQSLISKAGSFQAGTSNTDMAIDGNGFFIVRSGTAADSQVAYTRAGNFSRDQEGNLKNAAGYYLQGWPLDDSGNFANNGDLNALQPVNPYKVSGAAQPTTKFNVSLNLESDADVSPGAAGYAAGDMATNTVPPQFSRPFTLYDAQGNAHQVTMGFIKSDVNTWKVEVYANPATDVTQANGLLASGEVKFNGDGTLNASTMPATATPSWTNGAGSQPISLGLGTPGNRDGLTTSSEPSNLRSSTVDGGSPSAVASVSISDDGVVSAVFEDGTMRAVYQLPIATFNNPDGLKAMGGNAYQVSANSGTAIINAAATQGSGKIAAGQLEGSTADLGKEFTNMILFQRAYSASSKIITTVDDMLQELSNMKR
nr:flagellar hook protein FlgE [Sphingomonas quercus]